ncbi:MAG: 5-formyltetrahydrofolate cyclo-ligase [Bdellovibrionales bacterium]|nr:5-formyltetrahydrofolate cyclo-ligase [Bdellovibrionales bacterium]
MELKQKKHELRDGLLKTRNGLSDELRFQYEQVVHEKCLALCKQFLKATDYVAAYRAMPGELNLDPILFMHNYRWIFPKVVNEQMSFYHCESQKSFVKGSFNIFEPHATTSPVPLEKCPLVFIPGVGFDRRGRRLGMGKGYYDKYLATYKGLKVGVAYSCQITEDELPHEDHDLYMDFIITENFTFSPIHHKRSS